MLYLVDASVYIFRAYFSIPESMTGRDQRPINALYGYARFLAEFLTRAAPESAAIAFDESLTTSFRNEIYPPYKANRELPPPELEAQLKWCREFSEAMGLVCLASPVWEADDIIGTLAARHEGPVTLVTRDKDLTQLVGERDRWWDYAGDRVLDRDAVFRDFGVWPEQVADLLALAGDSVDNIPGVKGVGQKSAAALLAHFGDLDTLYAKLAQVEFLSIRGAKSLAKKLEAGRDDAYLARRLTTIVRDADIGEHDLAWRGVDRDAVTAFTETVGLPKGVARAALALVP
jgi:DNA polymerase I